MPFTTFNRSLIKKIKSDRIQLKYLCYQISNESVECPFERVTILAVKIYYLRVWNSIFEKVDDGTEKKSFAYYMSLSTKREKT